MTARQLQHRKRLYMVYDDFSALFRYYCGRGVDAWNYMNVLKTFNTFGLQNIAFFTYERGCFFSFDGPRIFFVHAHPKQFSPRFDILLSRYVIPFGNFGDSFDVSTV